MIAKVNGIETGKGCPSCQQLAREIRRLEAKLAAEIPVRLQLECYLLCKRGQMKHEYLKEEIDRWLNELRSKSPAGR